MVYKPISKPLNLNLFQIFILVLIGANIIALMVSTRVTAESASRDNAVFSSIESMARSFSLLQRDTLVFTTKLAQWGAGDIPRSEAQNARIVLGERLAQIREGGVLTAQFPELTFFDTLKTSDFILAAAKPGILSHNDYLAIQSETKKLTASLLDFSSRFALMYRVQLDQMLQISATDRKNKADANLALLLIFFLLSITFITTYVYRESKHYQAVSKWLQTQLTALDVAQVELKSSGSLVKKLRDRDEEQNIFISTINHELRTPLTSIIGYISVLRENTGSTFSAQGIQILDVIDRNSTTLLTLIEEILTLSALASGSQEVEKEVVDAAAVILETVKALNPQVDGAPSLFIIDIQKDIETKIFANKLAISQAVSNILANALKFSNGESPIRVRIGQRLHENAIRYVQIKVTDQGIGIPESQLTKIFTSFYRASNAVNDGIPGTGLGLAITSRIIESHQGSIHVESKVGKGSTFTIELPSHISALEKMIDERRGGVLDRAILAIESCAEADLEATCHEMIGALSLYRYELLGDEIVLFSKWVSKNNFEDKSELSIRRAELLGKLRSQRDIVSISGGELKLEI